MEVGHLTYKDFDFIHIDEYGKMQLIAKNKSDIPILVKNREIKDFKLTYSSTYRRFCFAYILKSDVHHDNLGLELAVQYQLKLNNKNISGLEITGELIDSFFSAVRYFEYHTSSLNADYLKDSETIDSWNIHYKDIDIHISFSIGDILRDGTLSDLKLHSKLTVEFPEITNYELVYEIYRIIFRFLQLVTYRQNCGKIKINTFYISNGYKSYSGSLHDYSMPENTENIFVENMILNYTMYKPYIGVLLQFSADNMNLSFAHFPHKYRRYFPKIYFATDISLLFAAFEKECEIKKEIYCQIDNSATKIIKNQIVNFINSCEGNSLDNEEKFFCQNAINRIKQLGTQKGQKDKIKTAYLTLENAISSSKNTLFRPDKTINDIANQITRIRGKAVHEETSIQINEEDALLLHFFEIMIYAQMLKRANLHDVDIEAIIGAVFYCNDIMFKRIEEM